MIKMNMNVLERFSSVLLQIFRPKQAAGNNLDIQMSQMFLAL
jgi:hypothetical protein